MLKTLRSPTDRALRERWWLVVVWLLLGGVLAGALWFERRDIEAGERRRLAHQAGIVHDNVARQVRAIDAVLSRLAQDSSERLQQQHQQALPGGRVRLDARENARLRLFTQALSGVRTLVVLDAQGRVVATSRDELANQSFEWRDYFQSARAASPETLVVAQPFHAVLGGWLLPLARTVPAPDGSFGGAVLATLDPEQFHTLLESVRYAPDMVTVLTHGDGQPFLVVSEPPQGPQAPGSEPAPVDLLFTRHQDSGASAGVLLGPPQPGGATLLAALRDIAPEALHMDRPLVATVARDWGAVLADWRADAWRVAVGYVLAGAAAAALLLLAQRRRGDAEAHAQALAQREQALETRWRAVLEATGQGVWDWREGSDTAYFSPAWKAMLGYAEDEIGNALAEWRGRIHPDDRARVHAALLRHLRGQAPVYESTHRVRCKGGHYIWLQGRGRVVERDAQGRAVRFIGTYGDVTEQRQQQLRLDRLAENVPGMLYQYQQHDDGRVSFPYASAGIRELYGFTPEAMQRDAADAFERIHPEDRDAVRTSVALSAQLLQEWRAEYRVVLPGRGARWLSGRARPERVDGSVIWHGHLQDVTEAKQQALQLQETERLLKHLMNEMPVGLCMVDEAGRIYSRNRRFLDYFGYTDQEVPTLRQWGVRAYPDAGYRSQVAAAWREALAQGALRGGDITPQEYRIRARDGTERTMAIGGLVFGGHFLATFVDRTEQQAQSELLRELAFRDGLTGVANRRHFDQTLEAEWRRCRRSRQPLALIMIDIDHFKQFNDLYGHQSGDACMRTVASTLRAALTRSHDLVARYGGEEFVCLLPECDLPKARARAEVLRQAVQALAIAHGGSSVAPVVTVSCGVAAQVPDGEHTPESLLARADANLYRAKAQGRNRVDDGAADAI